GEKSRASMPPRPRRCRACATSCRFRRASRSWRTATGQPRRAGTRSPSHGTRARTRPSRARASRSCSRNGPSRRVPWRATTGTPKAAGAPVKVIWSREDDIRNAQYRPANYHVLHAGLDAAGHPAAWTHRIVAPSIMARVFPYTIKNGLDGEAVEGGVGMPYTIPNVHVDYLLTDPGIPVGFWRSVNNSFNAFAVESFIYELAH